MTQAERLRTARARFFETGSDAARAHGWPVSSYLAHENGQNGLREESAKKYAKAFKVPWIWLFAGEEIQKMGEDLRKMGIGLEIVPPREPVTGNNTAPLMGRVGAGAEIDVEFEQAPPEGYDMVELPFAFPDPVIAFEVKGDSMLPAYEPGEVIVCLRDQVRATDHFVGERVVVRLSTGERYLKRLARGFRKGTYNLESWNARTIEDVRIEWVGEIIASVNPSAVRRVERRHQRARQQPTGKTPRRGATKSVM